MEEEEIERSEVTAKVEVKPDDEESVPVGDDDEDMTTTPVAEDDRVDFVKGTNCSTHAHGCCCTALLISDCKTAATKNAYVSMKQVIILRTKYQITFIVFVPVYVYIHVVVMFRLLSCEFCVFCSKMTYHVSLF